jgi:hypothetical protein
MADGESENEGGGRRMAIIRVFSTRTSYTPTDELCFFDVPGLFIPEHDEVHISCCFTWDKPRAEYLASQWETVSRCVKLGGPAYDDPGGDFEPGLYTRKGIIITSRGCPNNCKFCFVPKREGKLREIEIHLGNEIQDNNFLACSIPHRRKVYDMLRTQKAIRFVGGLEAARLTDWDIEEMRSLRIKELWLACDVPQRIPIATKTIKRLTAAGFSQNHIRCYVLIGDDRSENEARLRAVYEAGALPFAQLFQPEERIKYSKDWEHFARTWSRPAATKAAMKEAK